MADYSASTSLESFVLAMAPRFVADLHGPSNWRELQAARDASALPVNPQCADGSIYSSVAVNLAFRAWHDTLHLALDAGFDAPGELAVALEHMRQASAAGLPREDLLALWADTWLTFSYAQAHDGQFPENPRAFVGACLESSHRG
jgi:hypothetical protein